MNIKNLVKEFYTTDFNIYPRKFEQYLHPEAELFWNSSSGFKKMGYPGIFNVFREFYNNSVSLRTNISHLLKEKDAVTIRFTYYIKTIENPEEELPVAHFIAIWEVKDEKLYKGYQISQQADDSPENLDSFL